ncbi:MAG: DotU family type IV/VI secretion system protein [bacterium]|nr:DotU family type IV/VI secretion system protein [bacterium]
MTLSEVASDLFLFLVTFRRQVRKGLVPEIHQVRSQLLDIIAEMERKVRDDAKLAKLFEKARYPLIVTADEILINANWTYSAQWEDEILEYEFFKTRVAGEEFFTMIEDLGDAEEEMAEIFYQCLCLGFVGRYKDDAEELRRLKRRLYRMLPGRVSDDEKRITPDAYFIAEGVKDIYKPLVNLGRVLVVCVTLLIVLWGGYFYYAHSVIPSKIKAYATEMKEKVAPAKASRAAGDIQAEQPAKPSPKGTK